MTFMICVCDFPHSEIWVKVGIMEFGLNYTAYTKIDTLADSPKNPVGFAVNPPKTYQKPNPNLIQF